MELWSHAVTQSGLGIFDSDPNIKCYINPILPRSRSRSPSRSQWMKFSAFHFLMFASTFGWSTFFLYRLVYASNRAHLDFGTLDTTRALIPLIFGAKENIWEYAPVANLSLQSTHTHTPASDLTFLCFVHHLFVQFPISATLPNAFCAPNFRIFIQRIWMFRCGDANTNTNSARRTKRKTCENCSSPSSCSLSACLLSSRVCAYRRHQRRKTCLTLLIS